MKEVMRLYVGGINGVGKTTVCKELASQACLRYVHGSTLLIDSLGLKSQGELQVIDPIEKAKLAKSVILPELTSYPRVVFDTHFLVKDESGNEENLFFKEYDKLFNNIVLIEALAEVIYERRKRDYSSRQRELNVNQIVDDQERSREIAEEIARAYGIRLIKVDNSSSGVQSAVRDIIEVIEQ